MGKNDRLIQKIELFEKLSLYSSRATFLQRLAQSAGLSSQMKEMLESTLSNVSSLKGQVPGVAQFQSSLMDALNSDTPDMTALQNALQHISTQFVGKLGANDPRAQQAQQLFGMTQATPVNTQTPGTASQLGPAAGQMGQSKGKVEGRIDKGIQSVLGVNPDGWIGPQTRAALNKFKQNKKDSGMTDAEAFIALKGDPRYQEFAPDLGPAQRNLEEQTLNPYGTPVVPDAGEAERAEQERAHGGNPLRNTPRYTPKT
jgi:murein L,D-transpeptidase YcbB/YkuD